MRLLVLVAAARRDTCAFCGKNLIANPGADLAKGTQSDEVVRVPRWSGTFGFTAAAYAWGGGDVSATSPGPPDRGANYFNGGPAVSGSGDVTTGTQKLQLPAGAAGHRATLTGWVGGYDSQDDYATVTVTFYAKDGTPLGRFGLQRVTQPQRKGASELIKRTATTTVPGGVDHTLIVIKCVRTAGTDNDGMVDSLSLVLS